MKRVKKLVPAQLLLMLLDCVTVTAAGGLALLTRFDFSFAQVPAEFLEPWFRMLPAQLLITLAVFWLRRMYRYLWRYVSVHDVAEMALSVFLAYGASLIPVALLGIRQPRSVLFLGLVYQLLGLVGIRCAPRFARACLHRRRPEEGERVMLIGAGEAGLVLLRERSRSPRLRGRICCVIDDDPDKQGRYLENVPIVGGREAIPAAARRERITQIILAIPSATAGQRRDILAICQKTGCRVRVLPGLYQLVKGEVSLSAVKDVQVEDLLGREPAALDTAMLQGFLEGRTVLVTGGGGSIGSELCRQIARYGPRRLIILDIYENNAYDIQQELRRVWGDRLDLRVEIASVRDRDKLEALFCAYRPDIVFHAAAHKHVPLMEDCPDEAVKNNVFGTYHAAVAAEKAGVKKFVLVSTDKAVNPTSFMGATKRLCEMIVQSRRGPTEFCAVRFGNVLGSNGSVVPLFKRQIQEGGPVTITDKRIIRYFMTIPEAAQLVMVAGAMARRGQVFVLDMGDPVRILDLAENLIRLSGLEPYRDIAIQEIGLRPGEKLYEELLMDIDGLTRTSNQRVFVEQREDISETSLQEGLRRLAGALARKAPPEELVALMRELVPTYRSPEEVNSRALEAGRPVSAGASNPRAWEEPA